MNDVLDQSQSDVELGPELESGQSNVELGKSQSDVQLILELGRLNIELGQSDKKSILTDEPPDELSGTLNEPFVDSDPNEPPAQPH